MKYIVNGDLVLSRAPEGPLATHVGGFARWASEQGYARYSRYRQVLLATCFSRWLGRRLIGVRQVSSEQVFRYLRGPLRGRILDLTYTDATELYKAPPPTWVAGALIEWAPADGYSQEQSH